MSNTLALETSLPTQQLFRNAAIVILASIVIGFSGQLVIPLPFTPVPIATRNSLILLMAVLLGSRRGSLATFSFLAQAAVGLPVFAGIVGGWHMFLGPTGGYLVGYLVAAFITGFIVEKCKERTLMNAFIALTIGNLIIYLFGAAFLATFVGFKQALLLGVAPFLIGDALKILASLKILEWLRWTKYKR